MNSGAGTTKMKKDIPSCRRKVEIENVTSIALPILLLLRYNQLLMKIQIRFQYHSSMLLNFRYHSNQIAISLLRHVSHIQ